MWTPALPPAQPGPIESLSSSPKATQVKKQIRLNAIDMMCMGCTPGIWRHPRDQSAGYTSLRYWTDLARLLERGKFDCLFLPDIFGVYDVYRGGPESAFQHAVEFPVCDPMMTVPAMALVTEHLGFGVTGTISYEAPFSFARRVSTLDHLTGGRFAWNIVTGYLSSAARAFGLKDQLSHDERYDRGDEFMEVMYKLWEGSWEDDAVVRDKAAGVFADPAKIHRIQHQGRWFELDAYHLCEPSPQRTPVLFQAGASHRGRDFAATHAECVFIGGRKREAVAKTVADLRHRAAAQGRDPASVLIFGALSVIVDESDALAQAKLEDYLRHVDLEGSLTLISGYAGVDFSTYDLDAPLVHFQSNAIQSFVNGFTSTDSGRQRTVRELAMRAAIGAPHEVGSPQTIADAMEAWIDETGLDGFNLVYSITPGDFTDFVDLVVPELQRRGAYKTEYAGGTFREKLFGQGRSKLDTQHPAAKFRHSRTHQP
jgi:FMN-dependent oxidoreductase (nitrilotriacetate monooxygenase family)